MNIEYLNTESSLKTVWGAHQSPSNHYCDPKQTFESEIVVFYFIDLFIYFTYFRVPWKAGKTPKYLGNPTVVLSQEYSLPSKVRRTYSSQSSH